MPGAKEQRNWSIHLLYLRQDHDTCLNEVERVLHEYRGQSEYPLYVKGSVLGSFGRHTGLIRRQQGKVGEALQLFQAATYLNPRNVDNLKQVGRCLYLLGKHKQALEVYEDAEHMAKEDWVWFR